MKTRFSLLTRTLMFFAIFATFAPRISGHTPAAAPYNVLLLTPDQMGADFMHLYGYPSPDTPNLDEAARDGVVFTHGYSAGSWTTPSFGAILTGMFPTVHGMTLPPPDSCGGPITASLLDGKVPPLPDYIVMSPQKLALPQLLKPYGFTTAVDLANCWAIWDVASRNWDEIKLFTVNQFKDPAFPNSADPHYLPAPRTLAWAQQWLAAHRDQRFFFWLHFIEPHSPYNPPREYDQFKTPDDYPNLYHDNPRDAHELNTRALLGDARAINRLRQLYAGKILYVDHYLGEVFKTLRSLDLMKNTIVILVSDHGELMYSHPADFNMADHRSVYDMVQHVPLIIWAPNVSSGRRVDALAGQYDLLPTIFDLEGLPIPRQADGKSLKPVLDGTATEVNSYVYGEDMLLEPQYSVRNARYKLIETMRTGGVQCYDLLTDPGETQDVCDTLPGVAAELKQALDAHIQYMVAKAHSYSDWENNQSLAVVEQRDSKPLQYTSPADITSNASAGGARTQVNGVLWSLTKGPTNCRDDCLWAPPGPDTARVTWRTDTPLTGDYEISIWYGSVAQADRPLATDANFLVHFRGGSLAFPVDENQKQGQWNLLGRFHDPVDLELTNRASGIVVAGAAKFTLVSAKPDQPKTDWLASDPAGWVDVTPHKNLKGWTRVAIPPEKPIDPVNQWKTEKDGLLCEGNHGHEWLRYDHELANFLLHVEWRFATDPRGKGYNSGVFVRNDLTGKVWHQAQVGETPYIFGQTLVHGELGPKFKTPNPAINPLRPVGEWNTYEIRCDGPKITLWVNGDLTGEYEVPEVPKGYWGLEAEGYHIEFRNIKIKNLP